MDSLPRGARRTLSSFLLWRSGVPYGGGEPSQLPCWGCLCAPRRHGESPASAVMPKDAPRVGGGVFLHPPSSWTPRRWREFGRYKLGSGTKSGAGGVRVRKGCKRAQVEAHAAAGTSSSGASAQGSQPGEQRVWAARRGSERRRRRLEGSGGGREGAPKHAFSCLLPADTWQRWLLNPRGLEFLT